jgi:U3 small nucleolar RNA-associated protein 19
MLVAAYTKRLCRCALFAPVEMQLPLARLVRSVLVRYASLQTLVHRENATSATSDPFDIFEPDPSRSRANESSLWELKVCEHTAHARPLSRHCNLIGTLQSPVTHTLSPNH